MPWYSKESPTPFDSLSIPGLCFLDGDQINLEDQRNESGRGKYPVVAFPSGIQCELWGNGQAKTPVLVRIFSQMDLPMISTRDQGYEWAQRIARRCGYYAQKVGETELKVWDFDPDGYHLVSYSEAGLIENVERVPHHPRRGTP